jgi:hypothetical protein
MYEEETIAGNTYESYVIYNDSNGILFYQNKYELPFIINDYINILYKIENVERADATRSPVLKPT